MSRNKGGGHEVGGAPTPTRRALHPLGPLLLHQHTPSSYIYLRTPKRSDTEPKKPNSIAATFYTHEIPSWGLFRSSAGEGRHHGGLLHHHSPSDEV